MQFAKHGWRAIVAMSMAGKSRAAPEPIGSVLDALLNEIDSQGHFEVIRLARIWPEVVGETVARRTEVSSLKFHTAVIKVSSAMWIQELNLMKAEILSRLTKRLANGSVRDIRFVQGRLSRRQHRPRLHAVPRRTRCAIELPELSNSELRRTFEQLIEAWGRASR